MQDWNIFMQYMHIERIMFITHLKPLQPKTDLRHLHCRCRHWLAYAYIYIYILQCHLWWLWQLAIVDRIGELIKLRQEQPLVCRRYTECNVFHHATSAKSTHTRVTARICLFPRTHAIIPQLSTTHWRHYKHVLAGTMAVCYHVRTIWISRVCWDKDMGGDYIHCWRWYFHFQCWWSQRFWSPRLWGVGMLEAAQLPVKGSPWGWGCVPWNSEEMVSLETEKSDATMQEYLIEWARILVHAQHSAMVSKYLDEYIQGNLIDHSRLVIHVQLPLQVAQAGSMLGSYLGTCSQLLLEICYYDNDA